MIRSINEFKQYLNSINEKMDDCSIDVPHPLKQIYQDAKDKIANILENDKRKDICPICSGKYVTQCKCASFNNHTLESLEKGHGLQCANGHRWTYNTKDGKVLTLDINK